MSTLEEKRESAIEWLRNRAYETGLSGYVLDPGSRRPSWSALGAYEPAYFERVYFRDFPAICREWEV